MRVIFMGTPQPVVPALEKLSRTGGVELVAAVTPPDRERGRGRRPDAPPVKQAALTLGIPVHQPESLRSPRTQGELAELSPDVIVVAAFGRFLPPPVLELPTHGCLNLHPSLLPRHRGPSPVSTAILEGDQNTGVSLMLLDEGMDTGPVIAQRQHALTGDETAGDLTDTLFAIGAELLADSIGPWEQGKLRATPQDNSKATVSRKLERADGLADWTLPASALARRCRAYTPWPGLYAYWQGKILKLLQTSSVYGPASQAKCGVVTSTAEHPLAVSTADGLLALHRLQLEGRRPVSAREFLAGYPDIVGAALGGP